MSRYHYLTMSELALLNDWGRHIKTAFDSTPYLVGSVLVRKDYRDVDVRLILDDKDFKKLFPTFNDYWRDARYSAFCLAFSLWGQQVTGLPIDFQIQSQKQANAEKGASSRIPLGLAFTEDEDMETAK